MKELLKRAFFLLALMIVLTGVIYPLVVTGLAQVLFPRQANGSLIYRSGELVGSALIGQNFIQPGYFHGRPSAAGVDGYNAADSGGTNLGPTNRVLLDQVAERVYLIRSENGLAWNKPVPGDLVTASASGLDPHISLDAVYLQVPRVAKARQLLEGKVRELVEQHIEGRQLGFLGETRVNVLKINLALDALEGSMR